MGARNTVNIRKCAEIQRRNNGVLEKLKLILNAVLCSVWLTTHDLNRPSVLCLFVTQNMGEISQSNF